MVKLVDPDVAGEAVVKVPVAGLVVVGVLATVVTEGARVVFNAVLSVTRVEDEVEVSVGEVAIKVGEFKLRVLAVVGDEAVTSGTWVLN